jgi:uncharacterized protein YbjQ (UPF0145 family)
MKHPGILSKEHQRNIYKEDETMFIVTTQSVEGKRIKEYKGVVFGEIIVGINVIKDFKAGLTNFFGGRSGSYEEELVMGRNQALQELEQRAAAMGANAVVGLVVDYEAISNQGSNMLMIIASGTAVVLE